jgi:sulfite reductase (NADPH) hemoprotein beta-component
VRHLLSYLQAILRVYNRQGRRDNIHKARIKVLVAALGAEEFGRQVEEEWAATDKARVDLPDVELARIRGAFRIHDFQPRPGPSAGYEAARAEPAFARFARNNVKAHKVPGYGIINISLKTPGDIPGDASSDQMDVIADLADAFGFGEIRVTHEQNLVLPHVRLDDVPAVFAGLQRVGLAAPNIDLVSDIIACPGLDYCSLANARAIPVAQDIARRFADPEKADAVGELKIKISGCINACGHHHIGHVGILGVDRKGEEYYQLSLGGSGAEDATLASIIGPALPAARTAEAVEALVDAYMRERRDGERFLDTYRRVGVAPFKEAVYADAAAA